MKKLPMLFLLPLFLIGCGQQVGPKTATITGRVTDIDGLPIRGAVVYTSDVSTTTSSNGAYVLTGARSADQAVTAEYTEGGTTYKGQNVARTFEAEQSASINITVSPVSQHAVLRGTVEDRFGNKLQGASVFALGGGMYSSNRDITDESGTFSIPGLIAGVPYEINAGGTDYGADSDTVTLVAGESRFIRMILSDAGNPALVAPTNIDAIAWTSPAVTRSDRIAGAVEQIKLLSDPKRSQNKTRLSSLGSPIEVQLEWDPIRGKDVLGFGIYRAIGSGASSGIDFWRDPLANSYIDSDVNLAPGVNYSYELTTLGTKYPADSAAESDFSSRVTVRTLNDLRIDSVTHNPLTFHWQSGSGAAEYVVFVFDRFPGPGVTSIWNNQSSPVAGTSVAYGGGGLLANRTYYYMVLGLTGDGSGRTISTVGSFVPNP